LQNGWQGGAKHDKLGHLRSEVKRLFAENYMPKEMGTAAALTEFRPPVDACQQART
jgi:hypothetical protein